LTFRPRILRTFRQRARDALVIFSDGLPDAQDEAGDEFGDERLMDALVSLPPSTSGAELTTAILGMIEDFSRGCRQADDVTVIGAVALPA
jgi:sigma-B regulation protein RsbU (phosphoserine phosphatase)